MIKINDFIKGELNTESIQKAIDFAAENKKVLFFPKGVYNVTSLQLKSNSSIYLDDGAVISASLDAEEWKKTPLKPIFFCENAENVSIRGKGTVTANGFAFSDEKGYRKKTTERPDNVILFRKVTNVTVENITLKETVGWTFHLDNCDDVLIDGVIIRNPTYVTRKNSDGIDINGCRNVTVMNCDIETGDDAICLKNIDYSVGAEDYVNNHESDKIVRKDMYNINVYNCTLASTCNSTKIGTETIGNIYDVSFEKIKVKKHPMITGHGAGYPPFDSYHALTAISVQSNDGATIKNISFKDYDVETVDSPIFILYQQRDRFVPATDKGEVSNIKIENIRVTKSYRTSMILSSDAGKIKDVKITDVSAHTYEAPCSEYLPKLPTGKEYPDPFNFGRFPVFGLYSANADGVCIDKNVEFIDEENSGRAEIEIKG
ncbi:MAG: right-handed parallel beta-helix repeat-containing protein [Clostridia bacterium]|nr:right-handed parallel beta-helix repeat-containing protein [Clostridia bacterium]